MTDHAWDRWCQLCGGDAHICECSPCCECGERESRVFDNHEGYCLRCRSACSSCGDAILQGEVRCAPCERDLLSSNVLAPVRLPSLELA